MQIDFYTCELCNKRVPLSNCTVHLLRCEQRVSSISTSSSNVDFDALNADTINNVNDSSQDNKWICNLCTYHNNNVSDYCEICSNKQSIHNESCNQINYEHNEHEIAATNNWQCIYCTFDNSSNQINCLMCNRSPENTNIFSSPRDESLISYSESLDIADRGMSIPSLSTTILVGAGIGASVAWLNNRNVRNGASFGASLGAISGLIIEEFLNDRDRNALSEESNINSNNNSRGFELLNSSDETSSNQRLTRRRIAEIDNDRMFEDFLSQHFLLGNHTEESISGIAISESLDQQQQHHLSSDVINSFPIRNFSSSSKHEIEACPICLNDYTIGCEIKALPCLHSYHSACIDNWLRQSNICPICKFNVS